MEIYKSNLTRDKYLRMINAIGLGIYDQFDNGNVVVNGVPCILIFEKIRFKSDYKIESKIIFQDIPCEKVENNSLPIKFTSYIIVDGIKYQLRNVEKIDDNITFYYICHTLLEKNYFNYY